MNKFSFRLVLLVLGFLSASGAGADRVVAQEQFSPITIFIVRHAEKADEPRQDPPLSEKGIRRAAELTRLLSASEIKAVYTSQFQRTKLTGEPVAKQSGATTTTFVLKSDPANPRRISDESTNESAAKFLQHTGQSVLVVGHTNSIPDLIKALGGGSIGTIDEKTYDDLFIVTVYAKGQAKVAHLKYGAAE